MYQFYVGVPVRVILGVTVVLRVRVPVPDRVIVAEGVALGCTLGRTNCEKICMSIHGCYG